MPSLVNVCGREIKISGNLIRIARVHGDKYKFIDDPVPVIEGLRNLSERIDLFTFVPRLPPRPELLPYAMEWDNLATLPLTTFDHWWTQQIDNKTRNMVRKAEKNGVTAREVPFNDALVQAIWKIYNEAPIRQGKPFPHYGKELRTVYREEATHLDNSVFIGAFLEDEIIGFVKLVIDYSGAQAGIMNFVSLLKHREKAPTNELIAEAVRSSVSRGVSYLTYSGFSYGKKQRDSLSDFKKNNGFQKVDLPRYYVPFTTMGRLAFGLGLLHGLSGYVPEFTAAWLRNLRKVWYNRKRQSAKQTS